MESNISGVGVVDKSLGILSLVAERPRTLAELVADSGSSRATTHRLAVALEAHGLLRRGPNGRFMLGLHLIALGRSATEQFPLAEAAGPALEDLRSRTGESVQIYVRDGENRVCLTALESPHGLRTIVPIGAVLPIDRGSAGRVLSGEVPTGTWVHTAGERESGVASVSAPVRGADGQLVAAVSVSGPIERMGKRPGLKHGDAVIEAAAAIESAIAGARSA